MAGSMEKSGEEVTCSSSDVTLVGKSLWAVLDGTREGKNQSGIQEKLGVTQEPGSGTRAEDQDLDLVGHCHLQGIVNHDKADTPTLDTYRIDTIAQLGYHGNHINRTTHTLQSVEQRVGQALEKHNMGECGIPEAGISSFDAMRGKENSQDVQL